MFVFERYHSGILERGESEMEVLFVFVLFVAAFVIFIGVREVRRLRAELDEAKSVQHSAVPPPSSDNREAFLRGDVGSLFVFTERRDGRDVPSVLVRLDGVTDQILERIDGGELHALDPDDVADQNVLRTAWFKIVSKMYFDNDAPLSDAETVVDQYCSGWSYEDKRAVVTQVVSGSPHEQKSKRTGVLLRRVLPRKTAPPRRRSGILAAVQEE